VARWNDGARTILASEWCFGKMIRGDGRTDLKPKFELFDN
jgi:hypothetical protein